MRKMSFSWDSRRVMLSLMNTNDVTTISNDSRRVFLQRSPGVEICVLRAHPDSGLTFLIRMHEGARAERHGHPGGEETYVLSGKLRIDRRVDAAERSLPDVTVASGEYFFAPAGEVHEGYAEADTTFFVVAPGGLVPMKAEVPK